MKKIIALIALGGLCACTAGQTGAPTVTSVNPGNPNYSKLQFSVGTANIYGNAQAGLNVVSTLRQPNGESAVGADTPTITGPFAFTAAAVSASFGLSDPYTTLPGGGPSLAESTASSPLITGTPQTVHPGTPPCDAAAPAPANFVACPQGQPPNASTFGQSGGVFAMGLAPYNHVGNTGQSYSYAPYAQPMLDNADAAAPVPPQFVPWGGPPAFDPDSDGMGTRDGLVPGGNDSFGDPYFLGVGEGITAFSGVSPAAGTYKLSVAIATNTNGSVNTSTVSQSATLSSTAVLPTLTAPTVVPDANGDGGAAVTVAALPAPITEALVQIVDYGPGGSPGTTVPNCQGGLGTTFAPVYYTIEVTAAGTVSLPATDGPNVNTTGGTSNLKASPSICTLAQNTGANAAAAADNFTVQIVGFDYPAYEAALSLIKSPTQTPAIAGANGQSDITISVPVLYQWNGSGYTVTTLVRHRLIRRR